MSNGWPFNTDADENDPLTALRIAVASPYAMWNYIVTFDKGSAVRPTDQEAQMLGSFLDEYREYYYNPGWIARMAEKPLDVDGGANGITFRKYAEGDWGYRRRSWSMGPEFVPAPPYMPQRSLGPLSLVELMDRVHTIGDEPMSRWIEWKKNHADIFGG